MDPSASFIFWTVLTLIICIFGIIGNSLSGIIFLQKEFRSSTNYLLLGLTFSDLLLLTLGFIRTLAKFDSIITWDPVGPFGTAVYFWDWICTIFFYLI